MKLPAFISLRLCMRHASVLFLFNQSKIRATEKNYKKYSIN